MFTLTHYWYQQKIHPSLMPLLPFAKIFSACVKLRRFLYHKKILNMVTLPVPVIVVGNITVGGTGKTPMVIWLTEFLKNQGYTPGIITRGVGGKKHYQPYLVQVKDTANLVGDEALLLHAKTNCPVMLGINRAQAAQSLLAKTSCDIIVSDDGLQHYHLNRHIEIIMVDAMRRFGNQQLLPAGPLRESLHRLQTVDFVVENGLHTKNEYTMQLFPQEFVAVNDTKRVIKISQLNRKIHAVAGIGNPQQFFAMLENMGFEIIPHIFPDHYHYAAYDLNFYDHLPVVMTEKDATKCYNFANNNYWCLKVKPIVNEVFQEHFLKRLNKVMEATCNS